MTLPNTDCILLNGTSLMGYFGVKKEKSNNPIKKKVINLKIKQI